ncbi:ATP-dependent zinc protease family protein [Aliikangiella sp. IMCC44359]|uniref:ATP-dependent zinc protease family protein n=1 Tax=Aliikangiella sp. IMCC44359 TaxID=3459125 RepID=UPI00403A82C5
MVKKQSQDKLIVGALEKCDLPELGITDLHMRVDTGAKTSSLHVDNIEEHQKNGEKWVSFDIHPDIHNVERVIRVSVKANGKKIVKSSSADKEKRVLIKTTIKLANKQWPIDLTLTNRSEMSYLMLLGRQAMKDKLLVDPSLQFIASSSGEQKE